MDYVKTAFDLLPAGLAVSEEGYISSKPEELRLRTGERLTALTAGKEQILSDHAVREADLSAVLERATGASLHSYMDELSCGYISFNGLRIGVCGVAAVKNGQIVSFKRLTSLNIRIPAEFTGDIEKAYRELSREKGASVLIISPPGGGKTTALREIIRRKSNEGYRVSVVDERGEISGGVTDGMGFDIGRRSDVMINADKRRAAIMMLRTMNPDYIAVDEITQSADLAVMREIAGCGVGLLATAHTQTAETMKNRALYRALLNDEIFDYALEIHISNGKRSYECRRLKA